MIKGEVIIMPKQMKLEDKNLGKVSGGREELTVKQLANGHFTVSGSEFDTEADANVFLDHMKEHKPPHHGRPVGHHHCNGPMENK